MDFLEFLDSLSFCKHFFGFSLLFWASPLYTSHVLGLCPLHFSSNYYLSSEERKKEEGFMFPISGVQLFWHGASRVKIMESVNNFFLPCVVLGSCGL